MTMNTTKVDIKLHGKSHSVRLPLAIWSAFRAKAANLKLALSDAAIEAQRDCNGTLAEAITKWVGNVPLHTTRELWTAALVDAMRPTFQERGYPLPANIRATIAFTSQGWRGKRRGECWLPEASADGAVEIMVHLCETDPVRILNILTHELCHAAQGKIANERGKPKQAGGHGRIWKEVAAALDLKPAMKTNAKGKEVEQWQYALGDANGLWGTWAKPLLEAAGAMPHAALAEFVKKEKDAAKQSARMLKFKHQDCGGLDEGAYIWRASGKATADKAKVSCPCCGQRIENPHFEGAEDEAQSEDTVLEQVGRAVRKGAEKRAAARTGDSRSPVRKLLDDAAAQGGREAVENRLRGGRNYAGDRTRRDGRPLTR